MWSFASNAIASIGLKKNSRESSQACSECSDDEVCSNVSREEGLECPICWESFNIVENVPYVLWCGHTLCQNCVLGLQCAVLKFATQQIKVPFFVSCPWCHLLSLRLVYKGNLKFPRKNFFLLWMVESLNGDRVKFGSSSVDCQPVWSPKCNLALGNQASNTVTRRTSHSHYSGPMGSYSNNSSNIEERHHFSLHKSLDFFIHFTSKFPLVIIFLLILFFVIPGSAIVLVLYLLVTILFAVPSFLVLYFAYPALEWLVREISS
ncbi:zf-RING_LisH domain-containing protein [Cephalotus follicularis]|uniref:Zf-RING_LisH domain-containing protein n=1 Tax=Cephalotus follicularis TaxID=3775 RepID=A0A1Q3C2X7_CEPFO|nr:zf-RING_LisH domain-containing protein [Cephalotus follicularis]